MSDKALEAQAATNRVRVLLEMRLQLIPEKDRNPELHSRSFWHMLDLIGDVYVAAASLGYSPGALHHHVTTRAQHRFKLKVESKDS